MKQKKLEKPDISKYDEVSIQTLLLAMKSHTRKGNSPTQVLVDFVKNEVGLRGNTQIVAETWSKLDDLNEAELYKRYSTWYQSEFCNQYPSGTKREGDIHG